MGPSKPSKRTGPAQCEAGRAFGGSKGRFTPPISREKAKQFRGVVNTKAGRQQNSARARTLVRTGGAFVTLPRAGIANRDGTAGAPRNSKSRTAPLVAGPVLFPRGRGRRELLRSPRGAVEDGLLHLADGFGDL